MNDAYPSNGGPLSTHKATILRMGDLDLTKSTVVPVTQEMLDDFANFRSDMERTLRWALMGRNPWPLAGFNPHLRTFPEPEPDYCEECGRPFDEDEC